MVRRPAAIPAVLRAARAFVVCLASVLGFMVAWAATDHTPPILSIRTRAG
jgi:hypothetical protein